MKTTQEERDALRKWLKQEPGRETWFYDAGSDTDMRLSGLLNDADRCAELEAGIRALLDEGASE